MSSKNSKIINKINSKNKKDYLSPAEQYFLSDHKPKQVSSQVISSKFISPIKV